MEQNNGKCALRRAVEEEIDSERVDGVENVISEIDCLKFEEHGNNTIWGLHMIPFLSVIRF
ncbi:hypothetical protein L195_g045606 [Trifolium pratense]|uniref:Uncharacterized protein n=1 Tax=Trifolium pratense TaxID=57577 RepID=A0A2K3KLC8_TRIPR|nr:hypothetical protein L195_g055448 [Trifolium pratense]PNX89486.1 hypothetical protein L195_g045606 [Trifolium pratense]